MAKILHSKAAAWGAMALVLLVIVLSFRLHETWWSFFDVFFMFMMVFCQLIAVYIEKYNRFAAKKLQLFAMIFCILMVIALIAETIAFQILTC